jgi:hypothetical protein
MDRIAKRDLAFATTLDGHDNFGRDAVPEQSSAHVIFGRGYPNFDAMLPGRTFGRILSACLFRHLRYGRRLLLTYFHGLA